MNTKYMIEFYEEICCDECNEVIHNHFDCPICKTKYAGTDMYGSMDSYYTEFTCESCDAQFKLSTHDIGNKFRECEFIKEKK